MLTREIIFRFFCYVQERGSVRLTCKREKVLRSLRWRCYNMRVLFREEGVLRFDDIIFREPQKVENSAEPTYEMLIESHEDTSILDDFVKNVKLSPEQEADLSLLTSKKVEPQADDLPQPTESEQLESLFNVK